MKKYCYFNGKVITEDKAHISISDLGLLRGYGAFDFLRTYNGKPFLLKEHLNRLENSVRKIGLKIPISKNETSKIIGELMQKNKLCNATIKIVITGGHSNDGITCDFGSPTMFIIVRNIPQYSPEIYKKGIKMIACDYQRDCPQAKTTYYGNMMKLQKKMKKMKATEILYTSSGYIREGATSNFFIFKGNKLVTPKDNVLSGTTGNYIMKLAKGTFKVEKKDLKSAEIKQATEAFITSTTREIFPVTEIDNMKIGDGKVGKNTKKLMELFHKSVEK